ncbi:flippase-like domain-containing protein [candidate division WOR-3 bacterium]|nr:flippase-like domain-containing protein [candidate division WOR-3 bacterium]
MKKIDQAADGNSQVKEPGSNVKKLPASEDKPQTKTWFKVLRWVIQIAVIGAIGFFLVRSVVCNWQQVTAFDWRFNPWLLAASFALLCGTLFYMILLWRGLINRLGSKIGLGAAFRIFSISAMGRYLPGKVWQVVGMVYLGKREGVHTGAGVWAAILAQLLAVLSGVLVTLLAFLVEQERLLTPLLERIGWERLSLWWVLVPVVLMLVLIHPRILQKLTNWLLRLFKRPSVQFSLSYPGLLAFFILYFLSWVLYGTAFWLFLFSVHTVGLSDWVLVTGGFAAAYIVGLLAVFVPGGLGVREGLLALVLGGLVGEGVAVALSFGQRLWFTAAELTFVAISLIFLRRKKDGKEEKNNTGQTG